jgi:hypothetical protein
MLRDMNDGSMSCIAGSACAIDKTSPVTGLPAQRFDPHGLFSATPLPV